MASAVMLSALICARLKSEATHFTMSGCKMPLSWALQRAVGLGLLILPGVVGL